MVTDGDIRRGILNGISLQEKVSKIMFKDPLYAFVDSSKEEILNFLKGKN